MCGCGDTLRPMVASQLTHDGATTSVHLVIVFFSSILGLVLSFFSIYIEEQLKMHPGYEAPCDLKLPFFGNSSCSRVFSSSYANILSHWGLVEKNSSFDWSLPCLAVIYYVVTLHYPLFRRRFLKFYFGLSVVAITFSIYLASILHFVLQEFCIVCFSKYMINCIMFYCIASDAYQSGKMKKN